MCLRWSLSGLRWKLRDELLCVIDVGELWRRVQAHESEAFRQELVELLAFVREGDSVVVHSMDRLARNLDDLRKLVQQLTQRGCAPSSRRSPCPLPVTIRQCHNYRFL